MKSSKKQKKRKLQKEKQIFLCHADVDKEKTVRFVAEELAKIYKRENIFYDSWSIQPGDDIDEKIYIGLENCNYFFFFMSKKSIKREYVKRE